MAKNKSRLKTFKNWLLARDSSSRISTLPTYQSFLENSNGTEKSREEMLRIFRMIKDYRPYDTLKRHFFDFSITNRAAEKTFMDTTTPPGTVFGFDSVNDWTRETREFMECLVPALSKKRRPNLRNVIPYYIKFDFIKDIEKEEIYLNNENSEETGKIVICRIPINSTDKQIIGYAKEALNLFIENIDLSDNALTDFFKWWIKELIFSPSSREFPTKFQSAFIEWSKTANIDEVKRLYHSILMNADDPDIIRIGTRKGTKEIIDHINWGFKEFGIDALDVKAGHSLLKRFS